MKDAIDYLYHVKALILSNIYVARWEMVREEAQDDMGLFRYRLELVDGSMLEMFERFSVHQGSVEVTKYSFHWQYADGRLGRRWDNAAHHPEISTHPHHVHESSEDNVHPHRSMNVEELLKIVAAEIST